MKKEGNQWRLRRAAANSRRCGHCWNKAFSGGMRKVLVFLAASSVLAGCKTSTAPIVTPVPSEVVIDSSSSIWFKQVSYKVEPGPKGFVQGEAKIQNVDNTAHPLRYRSEWYSETGEQLGESNWVTRVAGPGETLVVTAIAYHPSAARIRLYVK